MDDKGRLFWKRFLLVLLLSVFFGIYVAISYDWVIGLLAYVGMQWFSLPILFRMTMND